MCLLLLVGIIKKNIMMVAPQQQPLWTLLLCVLAMACADPKGFLLMGSLWVVSISVCMLIAWNYYYTFISYDN